MKKRYVILIFLAIPIILALSLFLYLKKPLPIGKEGPKADALARKVQQAMNLKAWKQTGAVSWNFGTRNLHLWDRKRQYSQVVWGKDDRKVKVQFRISDQKGLAWKNGKRIKGKMYAEYVEMAYKHWTNDSFWLNPLVGFFDTGTIRKINKGSDGKDQLIIQYGKGGVTPGDTYLYKLDGNFLPTKWYMWVKIIPLGGFPATFKGWKKTATGVKISTKHRLVFLPLHILDLKTASSLAQMSKKDPFAKLEKYLGIKKEAAIPKAPIARTAPSQPAESTTAPAKNP